MIKIPVTHHSVHLLLSFFKKKIFVRVEGFSFEGEEILADDVGVATEAVSVFVFFLLSPLPLLKHVFLSGEEKCSVKVSFLRGTKVSTVFLLSSALQQMLAIFNNDGQPCSVGCVSEFLLFLLL